MDILDQIDRALREVDEDGYLTDAMRWVPDGDADAQDAQINGRYHRGDDAFAALMQRYHILLDNAILQQPPALPDPAGRFYWRPVDSDGPWQPLGAVPTQPPTAEEIARLYQVPPALVSFGLQPADLHPPTAEEIAAALQPIHDRIVAAVRAAGEALGAVVARVTQHLTDAGVIPPEPPADPMARALDARRNRNTGPPQRQRAPRRIDPRGHRT